MATYRVEGTYVTSGPGSQVIPGGTLVGDGTPYPLSKSEAEAAEKSPNLTKVSTPPPAKPVKPEKDTSPPPQVPIKPSPAPKVEPVNTQAPPDKPNENLYPKG
jgi:hypothetical protein